MSHRVSLFAQRRRKGLLAATIGALLAPGIAAAAADAALDETATANGDVGEVVITARHREERLQDVPLAISAVAGRELNTQHLDRISDYVVKVPNFSAYATNPRVATVNIRGLGGNASNDGAEGGVGVVVDDVFFTHVAFAWLDFVDLESVEVARGPQGTLLGKNTTIGAVVVRTAKPSFESSTNLSATLANRDRYQIRANSTGALVDDKLAYRLTVAADKGGGWVKNVYNGDKLLDNNRWSVRGQLLFTPSENVSDRVIAEHYNFAEFNNHTSPISDVTQNLYVNDPTGTHANDSVFSARPGNWTAAAARIAPTYVPSFNGPQNANVDTLKRTRQKVDGASNHLDVDFEGASLTAVTAWRNLNFRPENDFDLTPYPAVDLGFDVDVTQVSQEIRLASKGANKFDWTVGAYGLHENIVSDFHQRFFANASHFFISAAAPAALLDGLTYHKRGEVKVKSSAVFGQGTLHFTDQFDVTSGIRFTHETKGLDVSGFTVLGPNAVTDAALGAAAAVRSAVLANFGGIYPVTHLDSKGNYWSWLVNPAYRLTDDILLYASASGGAKAGAANTTANAPLIAAGKALIKPEHSLDYEAGIKSTWLDRKVQANLNLYRNDIKDYQAGQIDPNALALGSILGNVGKVRLQGFELETVFRPVSEVALSANVAYNDATYLSYNTAPAPTEYQAYLASLQGVAARSAVLSLSGERVIGVPKVTANGTANFEVPLSNGLQSTGYLNLSYRSKAPLLNPRSQIGWQEAFTVVNAGIGINSPDSKWSATLWSKNLLDKRYAIGFAGASAVTPTLKYWGEPRTFGLTVSKAF